MRTTSIPTARHRHRSHVPHTADMFRLNSPNTPSGTKDGTDINRQRVVTHNPVMRLYPAGVKLLVGVWRYHSAPCFDRSTALPGPGAMTYACIPWRVIFTNIGGNGQGPIGCSRGRRVVASFYPSRWDGTAIYPDQEPCDSGSSTPAPVCRAVSVIREYLGQTDDKDSAPFCHELKHPRS